MGIVIKMQSMNITDNMGLTQKIRNFSYPVSDIDKNGNVKVRVISYLDKVRIEDKVLDAVVKGVSNE